MSTNEIYTKGTELVFPVHTSVSSGDLVKVGRVVGVAQNDAFTETADSTLAVGDVAYGVANATTGIVATVDDDSAATGAKVIGHVTKLGTDVVHVRLIQSA
jgi:predicted RecA/RadA family phage recombinase